jgi:hypothetical protein
VRRAFDSRVVPAPALAVVRSLQRRAEGHLGGGAALSGAYLAHRLSADLDLFCHQADDVRRLVRMLPDVAAECGARIDLVRDEGTFVRATISLGAASRLELDIAHEAVADLEPPPPPLDGIVVESLTDLRANKLTCLLSRSEPRDLVDLLFLDRAGYPPERDLALALRKDAGIDPGTLAWLLRDFPTSPLPEMLEALSENELRVFRDDLRERFRRAAVGE